MLRSLLAASGLGIAACLACGCSAVQERVLRPGCDRSVKVMVKLQKTEKDGAPKRERAIAKESLEELLGSASPAIERSELANEMRKCIRTTREAFDFLEEWWEYAKDDKTMGYGDCWSSLASSLQAGGGDCEDYAIALAELVSDDGYLPRIVEITAKQKIRFWDNTYLESDFNHAVYLIEENKLFGIAEEGNYVAPRFLAIDEAMRKYARDHNLAEGKYRVITLPKEEWLVHGKGNLKLAILLNAELGEWRELPCDENGSPPR